MIAVSAVMVGAMNIRIKNKSAGKQSFYRFVRTACNAGIQSYTCVSKRIFSTIADSSAD
jgi:hypothetical protein